MIDDYKLLENPELILKKRFIIWGVGQRGKELVKKMLIQTKQIEFVDSNEHKLGVWNGISVCRPEKIIEYPQEEIAIVISPDNVELQEKILEQITLMGCQDIDIFTRFAVDAALVFMQENTGDGFVNEMEMQRQEMNRLNAKILLLEQMFLAELSEKSVYVYQSKKVASVSVVTSAIAANVYAVHTHSFEVLDLGGYIVRNLIKKTSGKIISLVRDPIARQISLLWQYWGKGAESFMKNCRSLDDLEKQFYSIPSEEDEFEWYRKEFENVMNLNIYDYPFDRELGYSIIEKDGLSLLLLKVEKIGSLEKVIGDFLEVENFRLIDENVGAEKRYKYAYQNYLQNVKIPLEFYNHYYCGNKYMDYFYTEYEKKCFYERWKNNIRY